MIHGSTLEREHVSQKLFRQSSHVFLTQMISLAAGVVSTFLIARMAAPKARGLFIRFNFSQVLPSFL